jgi:hypothetical protein
MEQVRRGVGGEDEEQVENREPNEKARTKKAAHGGNSAVKELER